MVTHANKHSCVEIKKGKSLMIACHNIKSAFRIKQCHNWKHTRSLENYGKALQVLYTPNTKLHFDFAVKRTTIIAITMGNKCKHT